MKLTKLRSLCDKAIEKYGDLEVGIYDADSSYDVECADDLSKFKLRVLCNNDDLPGESLDETEEGQSNAKKDYFVVLFYS